MSDEPPIIVGGGGSTYIWIRNTYTLQLQPTPNDPGYDGFDDFVFKKENYTCYELPVDLGSYRTHDGDDEGKPHRIKDRKKHGTRFYKQT